MYKKENKEKFPIWFPSHPPVYKIWRPTVFWVERNRKQAGPTLGGAYIVHVYVGRELLVWAKYGWHISVQRNSSGIWLFRKGFYAALASLASVAYEITKLHVYMIRTIEWSSIC